MRAHLSFLAVVLLALLLLADAYPWSNSNKPDEFLTYAGPQSTRNIDQLPRQASLKWKPWTDTYWPSNRGGIAYRYLSSYRSGFGYRTYTKNELLRMSQSQIMVLSPAEKLDILNSRYDYPTVKSEWRRVSPSDASWEGICHGWAPAANFYPQSNPITVKNADGIWVPVGVSDMHAWLSLWAGVYQTNQPVIFCGSRCEGNSRGSSACADINAGSFHLILANTAMQNKPLVFDVDSGSEVWNQPIYGYEVTSMRRSTNSASVSMRMYYGQESTASFTAKNSYILYKSYSYSLDLDRSGNIVGGSWGSDHPDFGWWLTPAPFSGLFTVVGTILEQCGDPRTASTGAPTQPVGNFSRSATSSSSFSDFSTATEAPRESVGRSVRDAVFGALGDYYEGTSGEVAEDWRRVLDALYDVHDVSADGVSTSTSTLSSVRTASARSRTSSAARDTNTGVADDLADEATLSAIESIIASFPTVEIAAVPVQPRPCWVNTQKAVIAPGNTFSFAYATENVTLGTLRAWAVDASACPHGLTVHIDDTFVSARQDVMLRVLAGQCGTEGPIVALSGADQYFEDVALNSSAVYLEVYSWVQGENTVFMSGSVMCSTVPSPPAPAPMA